MGETSHSISEEASRLLELKAHKCNRAASKLSGGIISTHIRKYLRR